MELSACSKALILISVSTTSFLTTFTASSLNVALPSIAKEFGIPHAELQYIISAYLIVNATMLVPFGKLADIIGRKVFFMTGLLLFLSAHLFAPLATSGGWLIFCRGFGGFAAAMFFSNNIAILSSLFPKAERGKALGTNVSIAYLGVTTGPFIGGLITSYWGWRGVFLSIIPIIIISLSLSWRNIPNDFKWGNLKSFDIKSAVFYITSIFLTAVGITRLPGLTGIILLGLGAVLLVFFFKMDLSAAKPFMGVKLFIQNKLFIYANLANFIQYFSTNGVAFMLSLFLQNRGILNLPAKNAGIILLVQPVAQLIISPLAGTLSDRFNARYIAALGMGLSGITLLFFSFQDNHSTIITVASLLLILGAGMGFFTSPNNNLIISSISHEIYGIGSGILSTGRILGMSMSIATTAIVFNLFKSNENDVGSFLVSFKIVFLIFFISSVIGLLSSLVRANATTKTLAVEDET